MNQGTRKNRRVYISWNTKTDLVKKLHTNETSERVLSENLKKLETTKKKSGGLKFTDEVLAKFKIEFQNIDKVFKSTSKEKFDIFCIELSSSIFAAPVAKRVSIGDIEKSLKKIRRVNKEIKLQLGHFFFADSSGFSENKYFLRHNLKLQSDESDSDGFASTNAKSVINHNQIIHHERTRQTVFYRQIR